MNLLLKEAEYVEYINTFKILSKDTWAKFYSYLGNRLIFHHLLGFGTSLTIQNYEVEK